ncbi:Hydrogenase expression/formation protein [Candidatus Desulfarcum epimagneticum]|uniref:Hydrogenase expression/formation protein n=1 Tax=uncultured Desulfobacteraceae bacterium TaxID=218296 RepID=A0A484HIF4_9BACT|nr:Hydrogenase expression/formation protein [uncultured Desulfobacteraceae bacterium]
MSSNPQHVMILGIGCILYTDEGFGVRVVERLQERYEFPDHVSVVDGGVLGIHLLGVISQADHLVVVDAVKNKQPPGTLCRIEGHDVPARIRAKNSLHQIDFLEALTLCQALDKVPETVILGMEPTDIETLCVELSDMAKDRMDEMIGMILKEMDRLGVSYKEKTAPDR